ncbi:hypothetical protein BHE74_00005611 [Ensete ventricosum]|nr:hypothetical protein BHE74_00005611 [Ensete ventricosum]
MSVHLTMFGIPYRIARYVPVLYWTGMLGAARYLSVPFVGMLGITRYVPYRQLIDMSVQYKIANIAPRYISYRQLVDILVWIGFPYRHTEFISATVSGIEQYAECITRGNRGRVARGEIGFSLNRLLTAEIDRIPISWRTGAYHPVRGHTTR